MILQQYYFFSWVFFVVMTLHVPQQREREVSVFSSINKIGPSLVLKS